MCTYESILRGMILLTGRLPSSKNLIASLNTMEIAFIQWAWSVEECCWMNIGIVARRDYAK
jgi:hypothetical protein